MGVKVSKPFTADQGRPFFLTSSCILRAVMSTAKAMWGKRNGIDGQLQTEKLMLRTVSSDVRLGGILRYVTSAFTNHETKFH